MDEQRRGEVEDVDQKSGEGVVAYAIVTDEDGQKLNSNTGEHIFMMEQNSEINNKNDQKIGDSGVRGDTIEIEDPDVEELDIGEVRNEKDQKFGETISRLHTDKDFNYQENNEDFVVDFICCCWMRRRRVPAIAIGGGGGGYSDGVVDDLEFGRDTNKHDYFAVTPWNVYKEEDIFGLAGGGGGGGVTQEGSLGVSSEKGGEAVIRPLTPEAGNGVVAASEKSIDGEERGISPPRSWKKFWLKLTCRMQM